MTSCATCRHFRSLRPGDAVLVEAPPLEAAIGECRRFPPRMAAPDERLRPGYPLLARREWPFVYSNDDCGEHAPRTSEGSAP